jgi:hypothetical protein
MTPEDTNHLQYLSDQKRWSDLLRAVNQHLQSDPEPDAGSTTRVLFYSSLTPKHSAACRGYFWRPGPTAGGQCALFLEKPP